MNIDQLVARSSVSSRGDEERKEKKEGRKEE